MKIVYILQSLAFKGGTERVIIEKTNYLSEHYQYDISIITCTQAPNEPNYYPLSHRITQTNLDIHDYTVYKYKYPRRLWKKWEMKSYFRKRLTEEVNRIKPDIIIGVGHYKADIICKLQGNFKIIIECHDGRMITSVLSKKEKRSFISKLYMTYFRWNYFRTIEHNANTIVTLTEGAKEKWRKARNVVVIPNISTMPVTSHTTCEKKQIIAVGRFRWEKGFDRLIDIWKVVSVKHIDWQLDIFGEGDLKKILTEKIESEKIHNVTLHEQISDMSSEYANSSICLVTSFFEGFSLVLLEAIKHGVPCIAYDCPFGPRSIIENGKSGFLIDDGNKNNFNVLGRNDDGYKETILSYGK